MGKIVFLVLSVVLGQVLSVDVTTEANAKGVDCVKAVAEKIRVSDIFTEDYRFLLRVAYVETKFGETAAADGIWKITQAQLTTTQNFLQEPANKNMSDKITAAFGNWQEVTASDLSKPLHCGLAMRIYLATLPPVPPTIQLQAEYWKAHFNAEGEEATFITDVEAMEANVPCSGRMKLVVALDASQDMGPTHFSEIKQPVIDFVHTLDTKNVPMGLITYARYAHMNFGFDRYTNSTQRETRIKRTLFPLFSGGLTSTYRAINKAVRMTTEEDGEGFPTSLPNVLVIFTKGNINVEHEDLLTNATNNAAEKNVHVFVCGINIKNVDDRVPNFVKIAQNDRNKVIVVNDLQYLLESPSLINERVCSVPQKADQKVLMSGTVEEGDVRYFSYNLPLNGALPLAVTSLIGEVEAYYSLTYPTPSSAIHDGVLGSGSTEIKAQGDQNTVIVAVRGKAEYSEFKITSASFILQSSVVAILVSTLLSLLY